VRNAYDGSLQLDAVPLARLGIAALWPELDRMQREAASLLARHREAEREALTLEQSRPAARERDLDAHADALRKGTKPPQPKHEAALDTELEVATRNRDALERAAESVIDEVEAFKREHAAELYADVVRAMRDKAHQLRDRAAEAARLYAEIENGKADLKKLAPAAAAIEDDSPAGPTTHVLGLATMQVITGPNRGEVEGALAYLSEVVSEFPEPVPEPAASPAGAKAEG
jgi:hypothetical protein